MTAKKITVRVTLDLDIDPETWDMVYGHGDTKAAVTREAREYVLDAIAQSAAADSGAILNVTETHAR